MANHDLSSYELLRLENIRRNNEFLASLGIQQHKPAVVKKETIQQIKTPRKPIKRESIEPQRSSKRIKGLTPVKYDEDGTPGAGSDEEGTPAAAPEPTVFSYDTMPEESDQLDDNEFEAFVELRKWRLYRMRELRIEPYKIFPNKTLCQLIRKRRNDPLWATDRAIKTEDMDMGVPVKTETTVKTETIVKTETAVKAEPTVGSPIAAITDIAETASPAAEDSLQNVAPAPYNEHIAPDLVSCFGIGPAKVKEGGFAWEVLTVLNRSSITAKLEQSRRSGVKVEEPDL